jgi:hypothetical protein
MIFPGIARECLAMLFQFAATLPALPADPPSQLARVEVF